jgi:hypothetical protein
LAAFDLARTRLEQHGVQVVAASTDPLEKARLTVRKLGLRFPVGYGLPLHETATTLTTFYEERRSILHATGFVVRPDRTIGVACYSTGPIGRLEIEDVLRVVRFYER